MSEKSLINAKDLINAQKHSEAIIICENILQNDSNNINALLMVTKCYMELNLKPIKVKEALEKVLIIKPRHPTATQGLRRFYEKYLTLFFDAAIQFYSGLHKLNELSPKDMIFITTEIIKLKLTKKAEELVVDCLLTQIKNDNDSNSIKIFFNLSAEKYVVHRDSSLLSQFCKYLETIEADNDSEVLLYVRSMVTFIEMIIAAKAPEDIFDVMKNLNIKNAYSTILFARLLCDNYLTMDCEETVAMGIEQLQQDEFYDRKALSDMLINIRVENLIHIGDVATIRSYWSQIDESVISKYLWCQAYFVGYNAFGDEESRRTDISDTWCVDLSPHQRILCRAVMQWNTPMDSEVVQELFKEASLSSFEWYMWATSLRALGRTDDALRAFKNAVQQSRVFYRAYIELAQIYSAGNDFGTAVKYLETGLEKFFESELVEVFVDLHMQREKYEEPLALLHLIEVDKCCENLLLKFTQCLIGCEKVTDAISLLQRIVKRCPNRSDHWQLLGDLYLKRDNINHAYKTYQRCVQLDGETGDNCLRLANVFGLSYQCSMEENVFTKSLSYYDKSLQLAVCEAALQGKASVLQLHAEVSLKHSMLSTAIRDLDLLIGLLIDHDALLRNTEFQMNLLGKAILLSIMGSVDKMTNISLVGTRYFPDISDPYDLCLKCLETSIIENHMLSESHFYCGLVQLHMLNKKCVDVKRGQIVDAPLFNKIECHLKNALSVNEAYGDAWKYLGYLYLKHGITTEKMVYEVQHCLSMAINISADDNRINDSEAAFYLGLLYIRENWFDLAREVFKKIKMDYPVDPIAYIGMYLLADKDHTVEEQPEIAKALMSFVYRDEGTSINDSYSQLNDSVLGLFAENMGFLVHSDNSNVIFDGRVEQSSLVIALRTALSSAWTKYLCQTTAGCSFTVQEQRRFSEYGCFLGIIEILLGDFRDGKKLVSQVCDKLEGLSHTKLDKVLQLYDAWNTDKSNVGMAMLLSLSQSMNISVPREDAGIVDKSSIKVFEEMLLSAIVSHLTPLGPNSFVESLIATLPTLRLNLPRATDRISILLALGSLLVTEGSSPMASSFLQAVLQSCAEDVETDERLQRIVGHLKFLDSNSVPDVVLYLHGQCLKQPLQMNRWLNMLEFGLQHSDRLGAPMTLERLFFVTHRPWSMLLLDHERYSRILSQYSQTITTEAIVHHRPVFQTTLRLFPSASLHALKNKLII